MPNAKTCLGFSVTPHLPPSDLRLAFPIHYDGCSICYRKAPSSADRPTNPATYLPISKLETPPLVVTGLAVADALAAVLLEAFEEDVAAVEAFEEDAEVVATLAEVVAEREVGATTTVPLDDLEEVEATEILVEVVETFAGLVVYFKVSIEAHRLGLGENGATGYVDLLLRSEP